MYQGMETQRRFLTNLYNQSFFFGGFGNGKSSALCRREILLAHKYPKTLGLLGRATYPELRDSTVRTFLEVCPPEIIKSYNRTEGILQYRNGSELIMRAFDDPRKVLSLNLARISIDQIEEISEELYLQLLGRLRDPVCRFFSGVGNPEPGWVKSRIKDNPTKDMKLYEATTLENPHLPTEYVETLKINYPDHWIKRYVYGDWGFFEGQVFSKFIEAENVIDPFTIPPGWKVTRVIDYGYRNPNACLWFATNYDDVTFIYQETYDREKTVKENAEIIRDIDRGKVPIHAILDQSAFAKNRFDGKQNIQVSIADEFRENGILCTPADNDIAGFNRANEAFASKKLFVMRNCTNTIREVGNLRWKKVRPNWDKNLPEEMVDKDNHTTDCISYFMNSRISEPKKKEEANLYTMRYKYLTRRKHKDNWYEN